MREPAFWHRPTSWMSLLLTPLGAFYGLIAGYRLQREGFDAGVPVLCVGNYHVGGAGKTPMVLALTKVLRDLGETPVVLTHGYGGRVVAGAIAAKGKPVLSAHLEPDDASVAALAGKRVLAFAGIGDSVRFFRTLRLGGTEVAVERVFSDQHPFSKSEVETLLAEAKYVSLTLVTTEKDLARLRNAEGLPCWATEIVPFKVTLEFDDAAALRKLVSAVLFKAREKKYR